MDALARFGVRCADADEALLHSQAGSLPPEQFFAGALELLEPLARVVRAEVVPRLERYEGSWHPTGFLVYPLGAHPELGTLRLHVWPIGLRRRVPQGRGDLGGIFDGDIHNHAWNIASMVLEHYSDNIYGLEPVPAHEDRDGPPDVFRVFRVTYSGQGHQSLESTGEWVRASVVEARKYVGGETHTIDAMTFHAPTIAPDQLGATLVLSAPRAHPEGPDVLIGGTMAPRTGHRVRISAGDSRVARAQLEQRWPR